MNTQKNSFVYIFLLLVLLGNQLGFAKSNNPSDPRPNIIIFLTDDLGNAATLAGNPG
jgi:hypothetical protein